MTFPRPLIDSSHLGKQHTLFSFLSRLGRSQLDQRGISSVRLLKALAGEKKDSLELEIEKMTPNFRVANQKTLKFGEVYILAWWFLNIFIFFQVPCRSRFLRLTTHKTHTACRTPESLETCQLSLLYHRNRQCFWDIFGDHLSGSAHNILPNAVLFWERKSSSIDLVAYDILLLRSESSRGETILQKKYWKSRSCRWPGQKRNADSAEVGGVSKVIFWFQVAFFFETSPLESAEK